MFIPLASLSIILLRLELLSIPHLVLIVPCTSAPFHICYPTFPTTHLQLNMLDLDLDLGLDLAGSSGGLACLSIFTLSPEAALPTPSTLKHTCTCLSLSLFLSISRLPNCGIPSRYRITTQRPDRGDQPTASQLNPSSLDILVHLSLELSPLYTHSPYHAKGRVTNSILTLLLGHLPPTTSQIPSPIRPTTYHMTRRHSLSSLQGRQ